MGRLASKLRIGEKIGFGFGLVGVLFLGVIWQYHSTLQQSLADYQRLHDIFGTKKALALEIENRMLAARRAEKDFLIHRDESFAQQAERFVEQTLVEVEKLGMIDESAAAAADQVAGFTKTYHQRFQSIAEAWRKKGLDHDSGLQGDFRNAVHELESMASMLKAGRLYLQLLQIRRGEKDLGLRREDQYRSKVLGLIQGFESELAASELEHEVKQKLQEDIESYRRDFEAYAGTALDNEDIRGGKGPFRDTAHRIEALLNNHYVPDLENSILQLRRREKDYLLRLDKSYVDLALNELEHIRAQVEASSIPAKTASQFLGLLENYQRDFLALVTQNDQIDRLAVEMNEAIAGIAAVARDNVVIADKAMTDTTESIDASTRQNERLMLWIAAVATALGIFFAVSITRLIAGPLRKMVAQLELLAYEDPVERIPFISNSRDEVNIMAESVDTMAGQRKRFIEWWTTSMREADACQKLTSALKAGVGLEASSSALEGPRAELGEAMLARQNLLSEELREIDELNGQIIGQIDHVSDDKHLGGDTTDVNTIRHSAKTVQNIIRMVSFRSG